MLSYLYYWIRPYQKRLCKRIGSLKTATILSIGIGFIQFSFIAALATCSLIWHFNRLYQMRDTCGSLSLLKLSIRTPFCVFWTVAPGSFLMIPFFGFIIWPICLILSGLKLSSISNTKLWPYLPAFYKEISYCQTLFIVTLMRWTFQMEQQELFKAIAPHFPPELVEMILDCSEKTSQRKREKRVRRCVYKPSKHLPPMDKKEWLVRATHFAHMPWLNGFAEYLVFVHPILEGQFTWLCVFSRDAALVGTLILIHLSVLYIRWLSQ